MTAFSKPEKPMKNALHRAVAWARQEKNERLLVILLPLCAIIISALILAPSLAVYKANRDAAMLALRERNEDQTAPAVEITGELHIEAASSGEDMFISVCDASGVAVHGVRFPLTLISPEGDEIICSTYTDGSCYLVELIPGSYVIAMDESSGYSAESVICTVPSLTHEATSVTELSPGLNRVDGKLYYQAANGRTASGVGIDISCFNPIVDWNALREEGVEFVILRIGGRGWGSGRIYIDYRFREYYEKAYYAGIKLGVYFYSTAVNTAEAAEEAHFVLDTLAGAPLDVPVYFDTEYSGNSPNGRADRLTRAERTDIINAFSAVIEQNGYEAGVYSGVYFIEHELDLAALDPQTLWIANYTKGAEMPNVDYKYALWQYTESGKIRGVSNSVDINVRFS